MNATRTFAITAALLLSNTLLAGPAHATAERGGWDRNGTSASGLLQDGTNLQAAGRGGWDGNGTSASGRVQGTATPQARGVAQPAPSADSVEAARPGGWDANGTSVGGRAAITN
jgi:hypothetical protein